MKKTRNLVYMAIQAAVRVALAFGMVVLFRAASRGGLVRWRRQAPRCWPPFLPRESPQMYLIPLREKTSPCRMRRCPPPNISSRPRQASSGRRRTRTTQPLHFIRAQPTTRPDRHPHTHYRIRERCCWDNILYIPSFRSDIHYERNKHYSDRHRGWRSSAHST